MREKRKRRRDKELVIKKSIGDIKIVKNIDVNWLRKIYCKQVWERERKKVRMRETERKGGGDIIYREMVR